MNRTSVIRTTALTLIGLLLAHTASAQRLNAPAPSSPYHFLLGAGVTFGGDKLVSGKYTNGDSFEVTAGGGIDVKGGVEYTITPQIAVQGTVGYQTGGTNATNGSIRFSRKPVEVLALWRANDKFRFGVGLRKATGATLSSSGVASSLGTTNFDSSVGTVLQTDYFFNPKNALAVRYLNESFSVGNGNKISGSHAGFYYFHYF